MNFNDYHQIMYDRKLRSNPMAEEYLASAMVCQSNINQFKKNGDDRYFVEEWEQKKNTYILKAIAESWGADEMAYPVDWDANCKEIRTNLYEAGMTREVSYKREGSYLQTINQIKRG